MEPLKRQAARVVVVDPTQRVLLVQYVRANGQRFWATPGGGLRDGETFEQAARREIKEEVGLKASQLEPSWRGVSTYLFGGRVVHQEEEFFLLRLEVSELPPGLEDARMQEGIIAVRWWSMEELSAADEPIFPENLETELKRILAAVR